MTGTAVFIFFFYVGWLIFSFLAQGETRINKRVKELDWLGIIPNYKFFCPVPLTVDYHLYYRIQTADGHWNEWEELEIVRRNPWICFLWNPAKRDRKVFHASVKATRNLKKKGRVRRNLVLQALLLNYVKNRALNELGVATQFRVTKKQDLVVTTVEKELFTSDILALKSPVRLC